MNVEIRTLEDPLDRRPDAVPKWQALFEPICAAEDHQMLSFILGYLFM
jgi:hypothetical protein